MTRRLVAAGLPASALLVAVWAWSAARRPNVLLITIDSLRPDYLSCYGGTHGTTPHIDALAGQGVLFSQALCDVPWSRGSMASVMTGQYATTHRVRTPYQRLSAQPATMPEGFRRAGYLTGAVVSMFELDHIFELDRGFETYDDRYNAPIVETSTERPLHIASVFSGDLDQDRSFRRRKLQSDAMRDDERTTDAAIGWLRRVGARRFFLWVHYFGGHGQWPFGADLSVVLGQYAPAVQRADDEIGRLLQTLSALGLSGKTLVVLHGDQGQALLDRGGFGHGRDLYEPNLRVPLVMSWPGHLPAGRRVAGLVRLVDLFPTIAELTGVGSPRAIDGQTLVRVIRGADGAAPAETYCETFLSATIPASEVTTAPDGQRVRYGFIRRGIRDARWKYIRNEPSPLVDMSKPEPVPESVRQTLASEELYDLQQDPGEQHNLIDTQPAVAGNFRTRLDRYLAR